MKVVPKVVQTAKHTVKVAQQDPIGFSCSVFAFTVSGYMAFGLAHGNIPELWKIVRWTEVVAFSMLSCWGLACMVIIFRRGI